MGQSQFHLFYQCISIKNILFVVKKLTVIACQLFIGENSPNSRKKSCPNHPIKQKNTQITQYGNTVHQHRVTELAYTQHYHIVCPCLLGVCKKINSHENCDSILANSESIKKNPRIDSHFSRLTLNEKLSENLLESYNKLPKTSQ